MKTLFAKTLLWFVATTVSAIAAVLVTSALIFNADRQPPLINLMRVEMAEAVHAYQHGGREELRETLARMRAITHVDASLTDSAGRDLLTGDHLATLRHSPHVWSRETADGSMWFLVRFPRRGLLWFIQPAHGWIVGMIVLLCYAFARHLTQPVRTLQQAVEGFGAGDLAARAPVLRKDELGQLAGTFNRMAERIQKLVAAERRLLMDISHELRSPLARLNVAVELARTTPEKEWPLDRIQQESERLSALVCGLLEVSRAEADPRLRQSEPVAVGELLATVVEDVRIEADAHPCRVEMEPATSAEIAGDPELLRRAFENVLRNAIRHSPPDGTIEVRMEDEPGWIVVSVRDYGPGVPKQSLPLLFDPFYRVDADRSRSSGGVGLGLSIARRAVELHHGRIAAVNAEPGLRVEIRLPLKGLAS